MPAAHFLPAYEKQHDPENYQALNAWRPGDRPISAEPKAKHKVCNCVSSWLLNQLKCPGNIKPEVDVSIEKIACGLGNEPLFNHAP